MLDKKETENDKIDECKYCTETNTVKEKMDRSVSELINKAEILAQFLDSTKENIESNTSQAEEHTLNMSDESQSSCNEETFQESTPDKLNGQNDTSSLNLSTSARRTPDDENIPKSSITEKSTSNVNFGTTPKSEDIPIDREEIR